MAGIIIDIAQDSIHSIPAMQKANIPYVLSSRFVNKDEGPIVAADNERVGYLAVKHLLERKPEAPVFCINGPDRISPTITRHNGYCLALEDQGIQYNERYVFNNFYGLEDAHKIGRHIGGEFNPPFSIFCSTDLIAIGAISGLRTCGLRIPEDVGVIGVDNIEMSAYQNPPLSTVSVQGELIGELSAKILIDLMEGRNVDHRINFLEPELVIRETT
jgi:DNA-binding LacI/PurR family transcriptional regulator